MQRSRHKIHHRATAPPENRSPQIRRSRIDRSPGTIQHHPPPLQAQRALRQHRRSPRRHRLRRRSPAFHASTAIGRCLSAARRCEAWRGTRCVVALPESATRTIMSNHLRVHRNHSPRVPSAKAARRQRDARWTTRTCAIVGIPLGMKFQVTINQFKIDRESCLWNRRLSSEGTSTENRV